MQQGTGGTCPPPVFISLSVHLSDISRLDALILIPTYVSMLPCITEGQTDRWTDALIQVRQGNLPFPPGKIKKLLAGQPSTPWATYMLTFISNILPSEN